MISIFRTGIEQKSDCDYASPVMGNLSVNVINDGHVLAVIEPIWHSKTETASRVRGRIEKILDRATTRKLRKGTNPARWRGHLEALLPSPIQIKRVKHMASLPYAQLHDFIIEIRGHRGHAARCLEFTILTAARTQESTGAQWREMDLDGKV